MLRELECDKFQTGKIIFFEGLNVVLGDPKGANSIGKSSMLMSIDFCMGGDDFIKS